MTISVPVPTIATIDKNGLMQQNFRAWTQQVTLVINNLEAAEATEGVGSPEGVLAAKPTSKYIDTVAEVGYIKQSGYGNTGWILI